MGLARVAACLSIAIATSALVATPSYAQADRPHSATVILAADRDDDDVDGAPDAEQSFLPPAARADLVPIERAFIGAKLHAILGANRVRVIAGGKPLAWSSEIPPGAMFQGVLPGHVAIVAQLGGRQVPLEIDVVGVSMRDGARREVDMARDHASLERTIPTRVEDDSNALYDDPDALRAVIAEPTEIVAREPLTDIQVASVTADGELIDVIRVPLGPVPCPGDAPAMRCAASAPLRFVIDEVDQKHPLVRARSLRAQVGGAIAIRRNGHKLQAIRVLGPRETPVGPIGRLRATLRPFVLRVAPGGAPAIGGTDAGATALLRGEIALASAIWGQCGVAFGPSDVHVVDPPPPHILAIGDDLGVPATGGEIRFRVESHEIVVPLARGDTPDAAADNVARAVDAAHLVAVVSPNARIAPGAFGSVDVSIRKRDGRLATIETSASGAPLTNDATLVARIGAVDLSDGLQHFGDMDSVAGTLEERTLLKAFDDGDPKTIEVIVVPLFGGGGRIGESFIESDLSSVRNVVILDRAGIRARRSSLTLAHELGHVLMDLPGHPDDYGVDTPTQLMDSDGSDASPFGPRRLTLDECARVVRQSGPTARVPLLEPWRLAPIKW